MSDFKVGDKVRLNDLGFRVLPPASSRKESETFAGMLTVSEVCPCPTNEDPAGQAIWFVETEYTVPSQGVEPEI